MLSIPGARASPADSLAACARAMRACAEGGRDGIPSRAELSAAFGPGLSDETLADAYAQTVCYALYYARCRDGIPRGGAFDWRGALRAFASVPGPLGVLLERAAWTPAGSEAAGVLGALAGALAEMEPGGHDAAVYGFEGFLQAYAPGARRARGVFYTPASVAGYVVRSADWLLREALGVRAGLADASGRVQVLDPAAGTGTFLLQCAALVRARGEKGARGLAGRLHGYELMPAACAAAQVALAADGARVHCRDALDPADAPWVPSAGDTVVVLGNPPYAGHSAHAGDWIAGLLRGRDAGTGPSTGAGQTASYFSVDGAPLGEKNPKWLNDDYVKFLRYAQWCVERAGRGVVAFVCNHGFLDHPTFRGVRAALMQCFERVMVLDLHGNAKRKERAPDGGRDQNVFDVQTGVCVVFLAKGAHGAGVFHADLWGTRGAKYAWLLAHDAGNTPWTELRPAAPARLFVPEREGLREEYERGMRLPDAMPVYAPGIVTGRDGLVFHEDLEALRARVKRFVSLEPERARAELLSKRDGLDVAGAQRAAAEADAREAYVRCLYRPFDVRWWFDCDALNERPRRAVTGALSGGGNLALIARRQMLPGKDCTYFGVTDLPASDGVIRSDNHGSESVFPLYVRNEANVSPRWVEGLRERTGMAWVPCGRGDGRESFGPEDAFGYAYAWFFAPGYREKYAESLRRDFPRVPWPSGRGEFVRMAALGARLVAAHTGGAESGVVFRGEGTRVERVVFEAEAGRVRIGEGGWFEGVGREAWEFRFGAYQPVRKWLEDRKGAVLSEAQRGWYARIVGAAEETRRVVGEIAAVEAGG